MPSTRALAYHNLSLMLEAGLPLMRSLTTAASGLRGTLPRVFSALANGISSGSTLAETMAKHKGAFAPLDVMIVQAAEHSGSLPESFKLLAKWYEFCYRLRNTILSGMVMPVAVLFVAAFVSPLPNLVLGKTQFSDYIFTVAGILSMVFVPAAVILGIIFLTPKAGPLRKLLDQITFRIPLLGLAIQNLAIARYCRIFHMLYKAGLPIVNSAEIASGLTGNTVMNTRFKGGAESAKAGNPVVDGFSQKLPLDFRSIWQTGEEVGSLDDVTGRLADNYTCSAELLLTELARWLVRLVYAFICVIMIIQIFKLLSQIGQSYSF